MDRSPLPTFLPAELERLEDALLRLCPSRQFQIRQVTFPTTVGQSLDITHTLRPERAEFIDWVVLQSMYPCLVYQPTGETFGEGYVRLACTQPGAPVTLLLMVTAEVPNRAPLVGSSLNSALTAYQYPEFHIGGASLRTFGNGNLAVDSWSGPALVLSHLGIEWQVGLDANAGDPTNHALVFHDQIAEEAVAELRYQNSGYHLQPAPNHNSTATINLGQDATDERWDTAYVKNLNTTNGTFEQGRSVAAGVWQAYTPTWTGSTTNPTLSNGSLTGRYTLVGDTVTFQIRLVIGSSTTLATGNWFFTLPQTKLGAVREAIGVMYAEEVGVGGGGGITFCESDQSTLYLQLFNNTYVTEAAPFAWGTNDFLTIKGSYEIA
jgi:hypothetical protein